MPPLAREIPPVSTRERPPRLVLLYAVFTALGVSAAAAVILVVVRHTDTAQAQRQAIDRARFAAQAVLRPELRAVDLSAPPSPKRRRELDRLFETRVLLEGTRSATLYGPEGRAVYSTARGHQERSVLEGRLREALAGKVVSDVSTVDGSGVLRTFVPIGVGRSQVGGVVALELDYARIEAAVRRSSWLIAGVLETLLAILFLIFVPVLARVSSRIRRHVAELDWVATHDELTGLPNRLGFQRAAGELAAGPHPGALLLLDLDGFSEVNDSLGSQSGDALLAAVAERLRHDVDEFVSRLGEDEFGMLLPAKSQTEIDAAAERVRESLGRPFVVDGVRLAVTVAIGAALFEPGLDVASVLQRAGMVLTDAKEENRSSVQVYGPEHDSTHSTRLALVSELRDALASGQLLVHYQPQADFTTRQIRGVEALVRWNHPREGLLAAGQFIACAERGGLARDVRHFVLEETASQWRRWHELGLELELAVNVSAVDVLDASLPDEVADLLERYGIPPWNLILEITERTLAGDERRVRQVIERLNRIGVRLAIDDFGTGYSSLASLRRFAVEQVKLDRSLLAGVPGDSSAEAIVGGSVEIAHGLGATVVAEGIETREQWQFAYLMGCDVAQGYLVGRPAPADEITLLLDVPRLVPLTAV